MSLAQQSDVETAARALPLGPDSLTWRCFGDNRMALLGPRAAVLQNMLPSLGQGVEDHSVWFEETLARLQRSIPPIFNTVYGADGHAAGHEVRDFHKHIKGKLPDGSPNHLTHCMLVPANAEDVARFSKAPEHEERPKAELPTVASLVAAGMSPGVAEVMVKGILAALEAEKSKGSDAKEEAPKGAKKSRAAKDGEASGDAS